MPDPNPSIFDVVITGAGPVGLFLACELRLGGASVLMLERAASPHSPLKKPPFGRRGLTVPAIEAFDRRGLLDGLLEPAAQMQGQVGHFAGIPLDAADIDAARWTYRLPSPADSNMVATMESVETILAARAHALGVVIRRDVAVDGFEPIDGGVTVHAGGENVEGRWLVGCDGGRSIVRKAAGFDFVGTEPEFTGYSVQVDLADPDTLKLGRHLTPTGMYFQMRPGNFGMVEFDGGAAHRTESVTLDHVQAVLRRISQTDVTLTALHVGTSWTDRSLQATAYRKGRVLLAGDAAHIHSPLGGQGLNLGLGDAMNLGWKLAATIRGDAADGLLNTYFTERHPIGASVLDWSRAQVSLLRPSPQARAMGAIIRDLIATRDGATYFAERVWNATLRHDLGHDLGNRHPLVGRSAPDFAMRDGTRLATLMRDGRGLLIDFAGRAPLQALARRWGEHVKYVGADVKDRLGLTALLVRPDGVVAWACEGTPDIQEAADAGSRWWKGHRL